MPDLTQVELLLRGLGVGLALALAMGLLRRRPGTFGAAVSAALAAGVAAYLVCSGGRHCSSTPWLLPLLVMTIANPFFFWWAARAVFEDGFRPRAPHLAFLVVLEAFSLATAYALLPALLPLLVVGSKAVALGLVAHALFVVARGWRDDLVEERRQLRGAYLLLVGGYVMAVLIAEVWLQGQAPTAVLSILNVAGITAVLLLSCSWLLTADPAQAESFWPSAPAPARQAAAVRPAADAERDARAMARLRELLDSDRVYRDPDLSVESLARKIGVPEHRLRAIINGMLGQRNFSAFINGYRLNEAMRRLNDPAEVRKPVLTIALDVGFGSIGPFNRAFKQLAGMTPTEYRARAAEPDQANAAESTPR